MTVPAPVIALVRSLVQALIGVLMSAPWFVPLLDWVNENMNLNLDAATLEATAFTVAFGLVVIVTNWLGKNESFQWLNKVISLFLASSAAVYEKTALAGGDDVADVGVDTGGEGTGIDQNRGNDLGAIDLGFALALAALVAAIVSIFVGAPWLVVAVICLAVAHLAGNVSVS